MLGFLGEHVDLELPDAFQRVAEALERDQAKLVEGERQVAGGDGVPRITGAALGHFGGEEVHDGGAVALGGDGEPLAAGGELGGMPADIRGHHAGDDGAPAGGGTAVTFLEIGVGGGGGFPVGAADGVAAVLLHRGVQGADMQPLELVMLPAGAFGVGGEDAPVLRHAVPVVAGAGVGTVRGFAQMDLREAVQFDRLTDVTTGESRVPLLGQRPVINPIGKALPLHVVVVDRGPGFSELLHEILVHVPAVFPCCKSVRCDGPVGEHDVRVDVAGVATVMRGGCVDGDVGDHPVLGHAVLAGEAFKERDVIGEAHLVRQRDDDLLGEARVAAGLGSVDSGPELGRITHPGRRVVRGEEAGPVDAHLAAVIEGLVAVAQLTGLTVGGGGERG